MAFEFATATKIVFGASTHVEVGQFAAPLGSRALVVTGRGEDRAAPLLQSLQDAGVEAITFPIAGEPEVADVEAGAECGRERDIDVVIGFGGGSALDAGKAIAALLTNGGSPLDYLEVIGRGLPLTKPSAPYIAIPTTAGTGAEVTRNAVLASPEHRVKVSMRSPYMLPQLAIVDPVLTYSMPPAITASTGLDALTQLIEPFVSNKANPLSDAICREGLKLAGRACRSAYERGDPASRKDMALASLFGGLALANAKLGAVHGFAGPIGGMYPAPHGVICARLLPHVMKTNVRALEARAPDHPALTRYLEVARILTGDSEATVAGGVSWVQDLCALLQVPPLASFGVDRADFSDIVDKTQRASSMKGNPIPLEDAELMQILELAT